MILLDDEKQPKQINATRNLASKEHRVDSYVSNFN